MTPRPFANPPIASRRFCTVLLLAISCSLFRYAKTRNEFFLQDWTAGWLVPHIRYSNSISLCEIIPLKRTLAVVAWPATTDRSAAPGPLQSASARSSAPLQDCRPPWTLPRIAICASGHRHPRSNRCADHVRGFRSGQRLSAGLRGPKRAAGVGPARRTAHLAGACRQCLGAF
jgi:hypothetical protein